MIPDDALPDDGLALADYQALAEFRYQIRRFLRFSDGVARRANLEPQQHQALLALKGLPSGQAATVGALAERLQIVPHSAVELVGRLAVRGLVQRTRGAADRRQVLLALTPAGAAVLRELSLQHRGELRAAGPALVRALGALLAAEASGAPGAPGGAADSAPPTTENAGGSSLAGGG
jgi:DNA-binding MarR family transcriptional regulator